MKLSKIVLLTALFTLGTGLSAHAQNAGHDHAGKRMGRMHMTGFAAHVPLARIVQKLDLTDSQRQSLTSLLQSAKTQRHSLHEQQRENFRASLATLPDDPAYPALIEKRKQLAADWIQHRSDLEVQIYALLTPEQKASLPALIEEMKANAKERRMKRPKRRAMSER